MTQYTLAGIAASFITGYGFWLYLKAIRQGKNLPNKTTWIVWSVGGFFILLTSVAGGALESIFAAGVAEVGYLFVIFALRKQKAEWYWLDVLCLCAIPFAPLIWIFRHNELYALLFTLGVDLAGAAPTIWKSFRNPETEGREGWLVFATASTVNVFAVKPEQWWDLDIFFSAPFVVVNSWGDWLVTSYVLYILASTGSMAFLTWRKDLSIFMRRLRSRGRHV